MKTINLFLYGFIIILFSGCFATKEIVVDNPDAVEQMKIADSLETASEIHEAAANYASVAIKHPTASFYKKAVLKAASLYCNSLNTSIEDSVALAWFRVYAGLPVSKEEKQDATIFISLLERIITLQHGIENLGSSLKKQTQETASRDNKIRDLENQIQQTKEELEKLKDIDVKVHKRGAKSK
jgi:hypothetical protein